MFSVLGKTDQQCELSYLVQRVRAFRQGDAAARSWTIGSCYDVGLGAKGHANGFVRFVLLPRISGVLSEPCRASQVKCDSSCVIPGPVDDPI